MIPPPLSSPVYVTILQSTRHHKHGQSIGDRRVTDPSPRRTIPAGADSVPPPQRLPLSGELAAHAARGVVRQRQKSPAPRNAPAHASPRISPPQQLPPPSSPVYVTILQSTQHDKNGQSIGDRRVSDPSPHLTTPAAQGRIQSRRPNGSPCQGSWRRKPTEGQSANAKNPPRRATPRAHASPRAPAHASPRAAPPQQLPPPILASLRNYITVNPA